MQVLGRFVVLVVATLVLAATTTRASSQQRQSTIDGTYHLQLLSLDHGSDCQILDGWYDQIHRGVQGEDQVLVFRKPQAHSHDPDSINENGNEIIDLYGATEQIVWRYALSVGIEGIPPVSHCTINPHNGSPQADEIIQLVESGPAENRIDIVFMGDGYTANQRTRFFDDMKRLVDDMFTDVTFASHLPLFNIWALFRASVDSGIGVGGKPKNTAFGLYRDGTELRGIYTSKAAAARAACKEVGPKACDYPTLIGNDDYYGGLGGEFTISTRSPTSGTIVLRHEFGHNLVNVGEEYDGGQAYFGVNHAKTLSSVGWTHWLTNSTRPVVAQKPRQAIQEHSWYNLRKGPYEISFAADGTYPRWLLVYSISGAPKDDSVRITLDGKELPYKAQGTMDRTFNYLYSNDGFIKGNHKLTFSAGKEASEDSSKPEETIILQLCNYEITEFKDKSQYIMDPTFIGAYNTYKLGGSLVGYRPDHETCLMRNMSSPIFCVVCQEGMWMNLLARVKLIDSVSIEKDGQGGIKVILHAIPLAQLRPKGPMPGESYQVTWTQGATVRTDLADEFKWTLPQSQAAGDWTVKLKYLSTEIRYDPNGYTTETRSFTLPSM